jgi:hypothetical protein
MSLGLRTLNRFLKGDCIGGVPPERHNLHSRPLYASFYRFWPTHASILISTKIGSVLSWQDLLTGHGQLMLPAAANLWFKLQVRQIEHL